MSRHTAGPWRLIERVGSWKPAIQRGREGGFVVHGISNESEDADARLIAAAPDLLEALIELRGFAARVADGVDAGSVEEYIEQADAAIRRATQPLPPPNEE